MIRVIAVENGFEVWGLNAAYPRYLAKLKREGIEDKVVSLRECTLYAKSFYTCWNMGTDTEINAIADYLLTH